MLEQVPGLRCDRGHRQPVTAVPEVAAHMRVRILAAIPRSRSRLLRGEVCRADGTRLTMPVRRTTRIVTVEGIGDVPALTVRFDLPMTRCPACALDQLPVRSQADLDDAVRRLTEPPPTPEDAQAGKGT